MTTPIELLSNLVVGSVESVSPSEVRILLELDAPHSTALNTGMPTAFPRINGYVLIPNEAGATVGYISWIGIERSPYPKRAGLKDFGLIDLPFPLRKMSVSPVGTMTFKRDLVSKLTKYDLSRGVQAFPSVGDQVLMPTADQVEAIVGAKESDKRVHIGHSPLTSNAKIMVDPDKLFGRHLAVLGNTGSGKSCTVAGLIRWSLESTGKVIQDENRNGVPNARFIVLDPNGEYSKAFIDKKDNVRFFQVSPEDGNVSPLNVPAWLWNGHEWTAVAHAQPGTQRPLLMQALRELKTGQIDGIPREVLISRYLNCYLVRISSMLAEGPQAFAGSPRQRFACAELLQSVSSDCLSFSDGLVHGISKSLLCLSESIEAIINNRKSEGNPKFYKDFLIGDLESICKQIKELLSIMPSFEEVEPITEDAPLYFNVNTLADHLQRVATDQGGNLAGFISTLGLRIRGMLADKRLSRVISNEPAMPFDEWLRNHVGDDGAKNGQLAIIDLSLVPSEIIHIVVSVLARLVFEAQQRYRREYGVPLPTVLVLEEAHTFIHKGRAEDGPAASPNQLCREIFERIAREGRKFGLGLVLSSQRPSELSATVLAQCNTFLLHRIVNDADQDLVSRLVPDNVGGLLRELPSLPSQQAVLLGWSAPIPVLVELRELPLEHQPQSSDPDFWDVWTLKEKRPIDWGRIAKNWTGA